MARGKTQSASDYELSVMRQCRRLVESLGQGAARKRVVDYLFSSLGEMVTEPRKEDPRQLDRVKPAIEVAMPFPGINTSGAAVIPSAASILSVPQASQDAGSTIGNGQSTGDRLMAAEKHRAASLGAEP